MRLMRRAMQFAENGWFVFPLRPGDKRPAHRFTNWEARATQDPDVITCWWSDRPYNIGIATGPSGLLVIDCDTGEGDNGLDVLVELAQDGGHELPRTLQVRTPTGGRHLYFTAPADKKLGNSASKIGTHIDTRGVGGYVVAAGSVRPEGYYTVIDRSPVTPLPSWLVDALRPETYSGPTPVQLPAEHASQYLQAILREEGRRVADALPGTRNHALNAAAFVLGQLVAGREVSEQDALLILQDAAGRHIGIKAFTHAEMIATIRSGITAGSRSPRKIRGEASR